MASKKKQNSLSLPEVYFDNQARQILLATTGKKTPAKALLHFTYIMNGEQALIDMISKAMKTAWDAAIEGMKGDESEPKSDESANSTET